MGSDAQVDQAGEGDGGRQQPDRPRTNDWLRVEVSGSGSGRRSLGCRALVGRALTWGLAEDIGQVEHSVRGDLVRQRGLRRRARYLPCVDARRGAGGDGHAWGLEAAAVASGQDVRRAYGLAGAHGAANTGCRPDRERAYGVLRLLTLATLRMPDLVLYAQLAAMLNDETEPGGVRRVALRAVVDIATGAVRLTHQAIEVHGRDLDYAIAAWIELAVERAGCELEHHALDHDAEVSVAVDQARLATIALTRATAATATDPMLVPAEAANAVGHLLTVYLLASAAAT